MVFSISIRVKDAKEIEMEEIDEIPTILRKLAKRISMFPGWVPGDRIAIKDKNNHCIGFASFSETLLEGK